MFTIGQQLWTKNGSHSGTVVDLDGNTVCLEQRNGAEVDFPASALTATNPRKLNSQAASPALVDGAELTPAHLQVLEHQGKLLAAVGRLYENLPFSAPGGFQSLAPAQKLNLLSAMTGVPVPAMLELAEQPSLLELTLLAGLGRSFVATSAA